MTTRAIADVLRVKLLNVLCDPERGRVVCEIVSRSPDLPDTDSLRDFLEVRHGLTVDVQRIHRIERDVACSIASEAVCVPMLVRATDVHELRRLAVRFVALFGPGTRFYSTFVPSGSTTYAGRPLFGNSIEVGLLAVEGERLGMLWVGDED